MRQLTLDVPYRYEDYMNDVAYLQNTYPEYIKVYKIGESLDGREILVLKVGNGAIPIIITAGVHGRETINPIVILRMIENYVELAKFDEPAVVDFGIRERLEPAEIPNRARLGQLLYELDECTLEHAIRGGNPLDKPANGSDLQGIPQMNRFNNENEETEQLQSLPKSPDIPIEYNIRAYLETFSFYVVPIVNPDGYEIALGGFDTIRNPQLRQVAIAQGVPYAEWKGNARGVDINRNFPSATWKQKFQGDYPGSEPETLALINLFDQVPAEGYLDLHSRGQAIYFNKGIMPTEYNERQNYIANRLSDVTGYELMPPETEIEGTDSGGNTVHYFSENFSKPAITIETVPDMTPFPLDSRYQRPTFEEIYFAPLEFASSVIESDK